MRSSSLATQLGAMLPTIAAHRTRAAHAPIDTLADRLSNGWNERAAPWCGLRILPLAVTIDADRRVFDVMLSPAGSSRGPMLQLTSSAAVCPWYGCTMSATCVRHTRRRIDASTALLRRRDDLRFRPG